MISRSLQGYGSFWRRPLSGSILVAKGEAHKICCLDCDVIGGIVKTIDIEPKIQHKHLMPAFTYRYIEDLCSTLWERSSKMVKMVSS